RHLDRGEAHEWVLAHIEVPHRDDCPIEAAEDRDRAVDRRRAVVALAAQILEVLKHLAPGDVVRRFAGRARLDPDPKLWVRRSVRAVTVEGRPAPLTAARTTSHTSTERTRRPKCAVRKSAPRLP